jgi:hypothetical protein
MTIILQHYGNFFEMKNSNFWFPQNMSPLMHYYILNHNFTKYARHKFEKFLIYKVK